MNGSTKLNSYGISCSCGTWKSMPRKFFDQMMSIYYKRDMHDKMFEIFADMEELGVQPSVSIVNMIGTVFQHRGMLDKYEKLKAKYPPPKWEFRYIKGKRVRIRAKHYREYESESGGEGGIKRMMRTQTKVAMRKRLVSARLSLRMSSTISWVETATVAVESRNEGSSRRGNDAPLHHISSPWKLMMPVEVRTSWDEGQILSFWTCRMPTRVEI